MLAINLLFLLPLIVLNQFGFLGNGIADGTKGLSNIAILPIVQYSGTWKEREYYGIYNVIEERNSGQ